MQSKEYIRTMSDYNRAMNRQLYEVCATIPDELRKEDRGAFFKSIHGTLNHLLLADKVWLGRFQNQPFAITSLDQELYGDFGELRGERERTDERIMEWAETLDDARLSAPLTFKTATAGAREFTLPLWFIVAHMFNHQTHHRGQLTTLLEQCGYDSGPTDLLVLVKAP